MNYISLSDYLKSKYGTKVYKLSLSTGCTCPNRDGTISYGGCIFCSEGGSGDFAATGMDLDEQIAYAREKVDAKIPAKIPADQRKYIAYFQSFTNTYGDEKVFGGLPSWLSGKESACQLVQSLIQEDPTCHTAEAGASQLLSLCYGAQELQLLKPSHYRA